MKYIVYLTKNLVNKKIYIGVHETDDPYGWDFYLGNGAFANKPSSYNKSKYPLHQAMLKYGVKNFRRVTLKAFDTLQEALDLEAILVDEKFIRRKDTYNITLGGGKPPILSKVVYQYDLNGNFIAEFKSMVEASQSTGSYIEGIRNAIRLHRTCNNFYWSHDKFDTLDISEYTKTIYKTKVIAYNEDLLPIGEFESVSEAAKFYDFDPRSITNAIHDKHRCFGILFVPASISIDAVIEAWNNYTKIKHNVYCYDSTTGDFIKEYDSFRHAADAVNLKTTSPISRAVKKGTIAGGCLWSYYKTENILKNPQSSESPNPKHIGQYDDNDTLIKVWDIKECRKKYPNIIRVCRGVRNKAYGYKWKYIQ